MSPFVQIFLIMIAGFVSGQWLFRYNPQHSARWRHWVIFVALRIAIPCSILLAMWNLKGLHWELAWLPLIGAIVLLSGFALGLGLGKVMGMSPADCAVYGPSGGFTNLGAIGSLSLFVYLGEPGLALLPLYKLFEELIYFGLLFPFAGRYSQHRAAVTTTFWKDPVLIAVLCGWLIGLLLNLAEVDRPLWMSTINSILVPVSTYLLMISVGLVFRFRALLPELGRALPLPLIRLILLPLIGLGLVYLLGLQHINDGRIAATVFILASMPAAVLTIICPALFGLNQNLANASWLTSTILFLVWLIFAQQIVNALLTQPL